MKKEEHPYIVVSKCEDCGEKIKVYKRFKCGIRKKVCEHCNYKRIAKRQAVIRKAKS